MTKVAQTDLITGAIAAQVVSFPTDTVPALAVIPNKAELIFNLKKRSQNKPLILMGANLEQLWPYITGSNQEKTIWQEVAQKYWPGQLTLVLPTNSVVSKTMNPLDTSTLGLRVPNHPIAQAILTQTGPLATTSANVSGQPPLRKMTEIETQFPNILTLDTKEIGEQLGNGLPSTVAKWINNHWQILRQGSVKDLSLLQ